MAEAPAKSAMEAILEDCIQNSLRQFMYKNAIFLCERLCAEFPNEVNLQLLAECYLRNNQAYAAYHILKGKQMAQSRYLFAMSCFQMDLLNEAEAALCSVNEPGAEVPNGAAGHFRLGFIYRHTDRKDRAVHHFKQALLADPMLWAAYEELCTLGAAEDAASVFGDTAAVCLQKQFLSGPTLQTPQVLIDDRNVSSTRNISSEDTSPSQLKHLQGNSLRDIACNHHGTSVLGGTTGQSISSGVSNTAFYNTPSPMVTQLSGVVPPPVCRNVPPHSPNVSMTGSESSPRSTVNSTIQAPRRKFVDEGKLRKISGRLFSDSGPRRSTRLTGDTALNSNAGATAVSVNGTNNSSKYLGSSKLSSMAFRSLTNRKAQSWANENVDEGNRNEASDGTNVAATVSSSSPSANTKSFEQEGGDNIVGGLVLTSSRVIVGTSEILGLLRILGEGYRLSCLYRCQEAIDVYLKLPHNHYNTGWVLSQIGKAHFELVNYLEADRAFSLARQITPYSLEGMDMYSTVLYHLKEDMKLSYLAQELVSTDRLACQSWCAMGNCYSLQKDHETALKNFQRAVQLDSRFAYAHTLCGHEYVALEDFENGIRCYQSALQVDSRHYNSWYGLGMIYLRQEKLEFSEHHFWRAFQINSRSSVIMCYLGTALHALKRNEEALVMMEKAIQADKKNPLPMYQKASILMSLEKFEKALEVLEELKEYAPRESSIYALMGRIYRRCNKYEKAMLHFGIALDLKPSATDAAIIKAAIEKLHVPDELEDGL